MVVCGKLNDNTHEYLRPLSGSNFLIVIFSEILGNNGYRSSALVVIEKVYCYCQLINVILSPLFSYKGGVHMSLFAWGSFRLYLLPKFNY